MEQIRIPAELESLRLNVSSNSLIISASEASMTGVTCLSINRTKTQFSAETTAHSSSP